MPSVPRHLPALVVRHTRVAVAVLDARARLVFVNPAFTRITGYPSREVLGHTPAFLRDDPADAATYEAITTALRATGAWEGEVALRRRDGARCTEWVSVVAIGTDAPGHTYYIAVFSDVSERARLEARRSQQALFDPLTTLPNRQLFEEHLRKSIQQAHRRRGRLAVLFLDLDGFKTINDTWGHAAGDDVLRILAERLRHAVRASDLVARRSGDEFTACLIEPAHLWQVLRCAAAIRSALRRPVPTPDGPRCLDVSVGIARYPEDGRTDRELLQVADARMYARKRRQAQRRGEDAPRPFPHARAPARAAPVVPPPVAPLAAGR